MSKKTIFTEHDLVAGLDALDEALDYFSDLKSLTPLQLITCGGFTALRYLKNRESTRDLDYFVHPRTPIPVREALKSAISSVGKQLDYAPTWCNDDVALFVNLLNQPDELFNQSIQQGLILYSGRNLQVYTVKWIWLLVRKMKRLQMLTLPPRMEDLKDCVSIANIIYLETGAIGKDMLQQFDHSESEPPIFWSTAKAVGDMVAQAWGSFPFILEGLPED